LAPQEPFLQVIVFLREAYLAGRAGIKTKDMIMQNELRFLPEINRDWRSKLVDGVLSVFVLCLTWLVVAISIAPVEVKFGAPGLLVYVLGLMAVALYCLQQALANQHAEPTRAWYGTAGGFLAWSVVSVSAYFGLPVQKSAGLILIIMVSLIVVLLWRVLPVGARFFGVAILLNWLGSIGMHTGEVLARFSPVFTLLYRATGYIAILAVFFGLGWILFLTRRRIERIGGALGVWFFVSLALYVFRGNLF
jgi:hypothetical protein